MPADTTATATLSRAQRAATGVVGIMLAVVATAGAISGLIVRPRVWGLVLMGGAILALAVLFIVVAARGRAPSWLPDRRLLAQLTLACAVVTIAALGQGVGVAVGGRAGRVATWGSLGAGLVLIVLAIARRWVPGLPPAPPK